MAETNSDSLIRGRSWMLDFEDFAEAKVNTLARRNMRKMAFSYQMIDPKFS